MIKMSDSIYNKILEDSTDSYPDECCGALIGNAAGGKTVLEVCALKNVNRERSRDRYEMDPAELLRAEKEARKCGMDIIGIYHSHPDHPARPSQFDRDRGWPEYSYVIVSVKKGIDTEVKSWTFGDFSGPFKEEEIIIVKE
ncbi:MAG TPA: M67 family metallopeptidase [Thermodesulfobacteriota bacterium]|nr:M67 family metallopeptidase [Thermodesulfobacteriota bacterium]